MFGGGGMRHVENPHSPVPVETRVSTLHEPVGVRRGERALRVDHERRDPDARHHPCLTGALRSPAQRTKRGSHVQPIADRGLVAVVDLDDSDRQLKSQCRLHVFGDVGLGDAVEVAGP